MFFTTAVLDRAWHVDKLIQNWMAEISSPGLDVFFQVITQLGSPAAFILLGILAFIGLCLRGHIKSGIILTGGLAAAWAAMKFLKDLVGRERPSGEQLTAASGMSFPSGHAMLSLVFYGFIAYLLLARFPFRYGNLLGYTLVVMIGLIGFSRIYLNVHYTTDVAAGFVLGSLILIIMVKVFRKNYL